ncbi:transposase [Streptomyces sp. NPDC005279]|uniref:transposase n=1 Tax=Streptomyces sp. NPDC005279 TaxID=3364712 RepID=UPI0036A9B82A
MVDQGRVIRRHELSDAAWEFVRPLLPESLREELSNDRPVLNGIVWKFRTGTAWRDVPERYGPWATLHTRFRRWTLDGTFERMLRAPGEGGRDRRYQFLCRSTTPANSPSSKAFPSQPLTNVSVRAA